MARVKRKGLLRPYEQLVSVYVSCPAIVCPAIVGEQNQICKMETGFAQSYGCPPSEMGSSVLLNCDFRDSGDELLINCNGNCL